MEEMLSHAQELSAGADLSSHSRLSLVQLYKCGHSSHVMDLCNKTHFLSPYDPIK